MQFMRNKEEKPTTSSMSELSRSMTQRMALGTGTMHKTTVTESTSFDQLLALPTELQWNLH